MLKPLLTCCLQLLLLLPVYFRICAKRRWWVLGSSATGAGAVHRRGLAFASWSFATAAAAVSHQLCDFSLVLAAAYNLLPIVLSNCSMRENHKLYQPKLGKVSRGSNTIIHEYNYEHRGHNLHEHSRRSNGKNDAVMYECIVCLSSWSKSQTSVGRTTCGPGKANTVAIFSSWPFGRASWTRSVSICPSSPPRKNSSST